MGVGYRKLVAAIATAYAVHNPSISLAQNAAEVAWKGCQASDTETRLVACTTVINAKGFGSTSRLADALDGRCWGLQYKGAIRSCCGRLQKINRAQAKLFLRLQ